MSKHVKTKVIFRVFKDEGDVIAIFPEHLNNRTYMAECYQHMGMHGECEYPGIVPITELATEEQYKPLLNELKSIGYDLQIIQRAKLRWN